MYFLCRKIRATFPIGLAPPTGRSQICVIFVRKNLGNISQVGFVIFVRKNLGNISQEGFVIFVRKNLGNIS